MKNGTDTDNRHFWKTIKPNFTDKVLEDEKIILLEDDKVIAAETDLAKILQNAFTFNALVK